MIAMLSEKLGVFWENSELFPLVLGGLLGVLVAMRYTARVRARFLQVLNLDPQRAEGLFTVPERRGLKNVLFVSGLFFAGLAAIGPQWGQTLNPVKAQGLDICFALDLSRSMLAEDVSPNRLQLAKNQLTLFLPRLGGDRAALVGFAGGAYIAAPLTTDHGALASFLLPMNPDFISNQATHLGAAVKTCLSALDLDKIKDAVELADTSAKLIVLVSDGEDTLEDYNDAIKRAEKLGIPVHAMALGTVKGGPLPLRNSKGEIEKYVEDPQTGQKAISKLGLGGLRELAKRTGGEVFFASEGLDAWRKFENAIADYKRSSRDAGTRLAREQRFQWPLLLALILLLLDFVLPETRKRGALLGLLALLSFATPAQAADPHEVQPGNPLLTWHNQRGSRAQKKGDKANALQAFGAAIAEDPASLESRFNWATSVLFSALKEKKGDDEAPAQGEAELADKARAEEALRELKSIEKDIAARPPRDASFRKQLYHQLGQAYEMAGQNTEALEAYYRSLLDEGGEGSKNDPLVQKTDVKNQANITRLLQPKAGQGGGGQGQGQGGGGEGDGGKGQNQKEDEKQKSSASQNKQAPKFGGTNIDENQGKQILESVQGEERNVRRRKSQNEARERSGRGGKDKSQSDEGNGKPW